MQIITFPQSSTIQNKSQQFRGARPKVQQNSTKMSTNGLTGKPTRAETVSSIQNGPHEKIHERITKIIELFRQLPGEFLNSTNVSRSWGQKRKFLISRRSCNFVFQMSLAAQRGWRFNWVGVTCWWRVNDVTIDRWTGTKLRKQSDCRKTRERNTTSFLSFYINLRWS